ncbi:MAG: glycosyltransferase family 2 protein [Magnetococcales bacterium]|nr:glycosyltransferase family 2 protein [Magnetococcales bacterium]
MAVTGERNGVELTVVIPAFNERLNVEPMVQALDTVLSGVRWEVIFVDDDSPDGTAEAVRHIAQQDSRVRCLHRIDRRGLSSACIEGMMASSAPCLAVMDADFQHDEKLLPQMLQQLQQKEDLDLVIGSRYIDGGSTGALPESRVGISRFATWLARLVLGVSISDPMSGFFMLKRTLLMQVIGRLSQQGFKILLDLLTSGVEVRYLELPYVMRSRERGESKLDILVSGEFLLLLLDKRLGYLLPPKFLMFVAVGLIGASLHLLLLGLLYLHGNVAFWLAQSGATLLAMTSNFLLNNQFTYRDRRLRGKQLLYGLLMFYLLCSLGALINIRIASSLYDLALPWWLSGLLGAGVGTVWNYAMTLTFTWRKKRLAV